MGNANSTQEDHAKTLAADFDAVELSVLKNCASSPPATKLLPDRVRPVWLAKIKPESILVFAHALLKKPPTERAAAIYDAWTLKTVSPRSIAVELVRSVVGAWQASFRHFCESSKDDFDRAARFLLSEPIQSIEYITLEAFIEWYMHSIPLQMLFDTVHFHVLLLHHSAFTQHFDQERKRRLQERLILPPDTQNVRSILTAIDLWLLLYHVPYDCRTVLSRLFYSETDGMSWNRFADAIIDEGATLLIVRDKDRHVFGAFAYDSWEPRPEFYGSSFNFLFQLRPTFSIYRTTNINTNYQYFEQGMQTLPNGLGLGGQLEYFGLWIDGDFNSGHCKAHPTSTTYGNPQLSGKECFQLDHVEAWCVRLPERDERLVNDGRKKGGKGRSALEKHADVVEMFEMAGRKMYSKDVRDAEVPDE